MSVDWWLPVIERLNSKFVIHRNYRLARARLNSSLLVRQGGECIAFTGPSRSGKTNITRELEKWHNPSGFEDSMDRRPMVRFRVRNKGDKGKFTTRTFYLNALKAIKHPFYQITGKDLIEQAAKIRRMHTDPNDVLGDILESALEVLEVKNVVVDEAHHLRYIQGGDVAAFQVLESLKTMAESLGCVIVFVGAYPILEVLKLAPHIIGREQIVEIKRYQADSEADLLAFEQCLAWFSEGIIFEKGVTSLRDWNDNLFDGSLGVPGLLNAWLRDAISEMIALGDERLAAKHLKNAMKPVAELSELLTEIEAGEQHMVKPEWRSDDPSPESSNTSDEDDSSTDVNNKDSNQSPFQTKPERRKVGGRS